MKNWLRDVFYGWTKWHPSYCDCPLCKIRRWLESDHDDGRPMYGFTG